MNFPESVSALGCPRLGLHRVERLSEGLAVEWLTVETLDQVERINHRRGGLNARLANSRPTFGSGGHASERTKLYAKGRQGGWR
jgi:hypothetical protein